LGLTLIGYRARDSPDDEEKEILSSTSLNVREVWDGNRIIRQTGESITKEYVYAPSRAEYPNVGAKPIITALEGSSLEYRAAKYRRDKVVIDEFEEWELGEQPLLPTDFVVKKSPNLTLNVKNAVPETWKVRSIMGIGLLVQIGVLVFNAIAVYYWRWLRAGSAISSYGYPIWAIGTVSLILGVPCINLCASRRGQHYCLHYLPITC
jgi:hypothetical protein